MSARCLSQSHWNFAGGTRGGIEILTKHITGPIQYETSAQFIEQERK